MAEPQPGLETVTVIVVSGLEGLLEQRLEGDVALAPSW